MPRRFPKKHCSVLTWIEEQDADFAQAIRDLCLVGQLTPRRSGVTFLMPSAATRKSIMEKVGSNTEQAVVAITAHILPFYFTKGTEFTGEFGSKAGVKLEAEKRAADEVTLKGGAVLKRSGFQALARRSASGTALEPNTAVWEVAKGEVPTAGESFDPLARRAKTGGAEAFSANATRAEIMLRVLNEGLAEMSTRKTQLKLLEALMGLLRQLCDNFTDDYYKAYCALDRSPLATLLILVEPFKDVSKSQDYFISEAAIVAWGGATSHIEDVAGNMLDIFQEMEKRGQALHNSLSGGMVEVPKIFSQPDSVYAQSAGITNTLIANASLNTPGQILAVYEDLTQNNRIGAVSDVYPQAVLPALQNGRKAWQDLLRFEVHKLEAQSLRVTDQASATTFMNDFNTTVRTRLPGSEYAQEVADLMGQCASGPSRAAQGAEISNACDWVNSTDFLYFPRSTAFVQKIGAGNPAVSPMARTEPINADAHSHGMLMNTQKHGERLSTDYSKPL